VPTCVSGLQDFCNRSEVLNFDSLRYCDKTFCCGVLKSWVLEFPNLHWFYICTVILRYRSLIPRPDKADLQQDSLIAGRQRERGERRERLLFLSPPGAAANEGRSTVRLSRAEAGRGAATTAEGPEGPEGLATHESCLPVP
jgi:hypothetical protein